MQFLSTTLVVAALALAGSALPHVPGSQCTTGTAQCCDTAPGASDNLFTLLTQLNYEWYKGTYVGTSCTPVDLSSLGLGCTETLFCCQGEVYGDYTLGCTSYIGNGGTSTVGI